MYPQMEDLLLEYTKEYNFPIIKCNNFGHKIVNSIIPIGVDIKINSSNQEVKIIEPFIKLWYTFLRLEIILIWLRKFIHK